MITPEEIYDEITAAELGKIVVDLNDTYTSGAYLEFREIGV